METQKTKVVASSERGVRRAILVSDALRELLSSDGFSLVFHKGDKVAAITVGDATLLSPGLKAALQSIGSRESFSLALWIDQAACSS
ncbi:MAG: hypothetical protein UY48_C0038G0025 [Candidatus Gottesmanbacteria bacterium GW2011_GWB1_49_7]|uniref:Uncharacterized protein n=1 Tax=Candidatus Gottesmanbacteria bacterium GW2011_GWB1_49_7 TaxID=1618448 RepID=A0A0G1VVS6_9BACT|nr:MAG: hypothetical protein UY48_C0038G0025 [Candidatus Gottesmanbacteria bacterium GW2011_GWB1_49_7]